MTLGEQILLVRRSHKATQEDLARKAGVSRNTIIAIERGDVNIKFETILAVCKAAGLQVVLKPMDGNGGGEG